MGRLIGPDDNSRLVYIPAGSVLGNAAGRVATVYANSNCTTLADIRAYDGTETPGAVIAGSQLTVDVNSFLPRFWFPENEVDTVYVSVAGGPCVPVHADFDVRIDRISGGVNAPMISTGLVSGGEITLTAGNPQAIDIAPLVGYIVNYNTDPANPTVTRLSTSTPLTVVLDAAAQLRVATWFLMDQTGAVLQQPSRPSNSQRRTHLQLGAVAYDASSGTIFVDQTLPVITAHAVPQLYDLMYALGSFSVTGNVISPAGTDLTFAKTSGVLFAPSFNWFAGSVLTNDPHVSELVAQSPVSFRYSTRSVVAINPLRTTIDPVNFDVGGVVTPVGGGANSSTIQRVFAFATNDATTQISVQYGQTVYASLAAAQSALYSTPYVVNPNIASSGALLGHIIVTRTATNLSDTAQASFHLASKFERA